MNYLLTLFVLTFIGLTFAQTCNDVNEEYKECGTACPRTCAHPEKNKICIEICKEGCFCKEPLVRDESTGQCVLETRCTKRVCSGPHEKYTDCGSACPLTCANMNQTGRMCPAVCKSGCFCENGFVRDLNGICVLKKNCPQLVKDEVCSDSNEEFKECGTACPLTCKNMNDKSRICTMQCVKGCFCREPFVRDETNGKCVVRDECPKNDICTDANEIFNECGTDCPITCKNYQTPPEGCDRMCRTGCFCTEPYIRDEDSNKCVLRKECPIKEVCADPNEIFKPCGTDCPITCKNYENPPQVCDQRCRIGCFCAEPYVRDEDSGKCVLTKNCKKSNFFSSLFKFFGFSF